ncbi:MAG: exo-alpha-sialidase [Clostridia bacterium]|nr:exo-alpha-sialidase [Clostridia bacterium]
MKLILGPETVICRGIRPEEKMWGPYQFPRPFDLSENGRLGDRILVSVHVEDDDIRHTGKPTLWFESLDKGQTWRETDASVAAECGLRLPNGDRLYFPLESGISLKDYRFPSFQMLTPGYDFTAQAEEGVMPIQDGMTFWFGGTTILAYNADRLPPSLAKKEWRVARIPAGETEAVYEYAAVDWPYLTRVVFTGPGYDHVLKPIYPRGTPRLGPDGAIWVSAFTGEGHLNPANGQYSPYYAAELFRSDDMGHTFRRRGHMEYPADGDAFPYQSGGFSDSDFAFMEDGSILWFFRSAWFASTGYEWAPMYWSRSTDNGYTWSRPEKFAPTGILPRLCPLACGTTLVCYARPGIFVQASLDRNGYQWSEPLVVMTPDDRSSLANIPTQNPNFHQWDGACNNPELLPIDDHTALLFYSDFYYPDETGVKRKTILCRTITVSEES